MDTTIPELHYPDHQAPVWHSPYWAEVVAREQRVREEVAAEYRRDMKRIYDLAMEQKNLEMAFQCQQALAKHYELYKTSPLITRCKRLASSPAGEEIWQQLQELRKAWLANSTQEKQPVPENYYDQVRQAWRKRDAHVRQSLKDVMLEKTMRALDKHEREKQADENKQPEATDRSPASPTSDTGHHVSLSSSNKLNINSGMTEEVASAPRVNHLPLSAASQAMLAAVSVPNPETMSSTEVLKAMLNALAGNLEVKKENTPPDPEPPTQDSG